MNIFLVMGFMGHRKLDLEQLNLEFMGDKNYERYSGY
jgi:hypothetical protein